MCDWSCHSSLSEWLHRHCLAKTFLTSFMSLFWRKAPRSFWNTWEAKSKVCGSVALHFKENLSKKWKWSRTYWGCLFKSKFLQLPCNYPELSLLSSLLLHFHAVPFSYSIRQYWLADILCWGVSFRKITFSVFLWFLYAFYMRNSSSFSYFFSEHNGKFTWGKTTEFTGHVKYHMEVIMLHLDGKICLTS